ncbi:MAG: YfhO family protein [Candidatus Firestonebacteria bacterium]
MKPRIPAVYIVSLILLCIFFWSEMVFLNKIPFYRDIILQFYPWQVFANNSVGSGVIPLWNNYSGCGAPFIANLQSAVFYPLKLIFYLLPFVPAVKLFIVTHFILAAVFMFYLARDFKVSDKAAFFAALVFTFNGYMVSRVEFFSVLTASVWIPLVILMLKKFLETGKFGYFALSSLAISMPVFAGSVQIYFYNFIIALAFVVWYSIYLKKGWLRNTGYFIAATVISLMIASVQLLPFFEFVMNSVRQSGMPYSFASNWSLHPAKLINFLTPFIWGNPSVSAYYGRDQFWVSCFYCGVLPVILLIVYYVHKARERPTPAKPEKQIVFFSLVLLFFLVVSLGKYGLIHWILYEIIPPFRMIRYPGAAIYAVVFCLAVISGLLIEKVTALVSAKIFFRRVIPSISLLVLLQAGVCIYLNFIKNNADPVYLKTANYSVFTGIAMIVSASIFLYFFAAKRLSKTALLTVLSALLFFDLFVNSNGILPLGNTGEVLAEPETVKYLKADSSDYRVDPAPNAVIDFRLLYQDDRRHMNGYPYNKYIKDVKNILHDNYGVMCGIECSEVYDPMRISRQDKYFGCLMGQKSARESPLLNLANIKYLLSRQKIQEEGFIERAEFGGVKIYENQKVLPRAFVVYNTENAPDSNESFHKVSAKEFLPSETAVIEGEDTEFLKSKGKKSTSAGAVYVSANKVRVNYNAPAPGILVLLDSYYPGWEAYVDGVSGKILRTNYMFRGVLVPAGVHTVEFIYKPVSFRTGVAVSLLTFVFLLLASIWLWAKNIYR